MQINPGNKHQEDGEQLEPSWKNRKMSRQTSVISQRMTFKMPLVPFHKPCDMICCLSRGKIMSSIKSAEQMCKQK